MTLLALLSALACGARSREFQAEGLCRPSAWWAALAGAFGAIALTRIADAAQVVVAAAQRIDL